MPNLGMTFSFAPLESENCLWVEGVVTFIAIVISHKAKQGKDLAALFMINYFQGALQSIKY